MLITFIFVFIDKKAKKKIQKKFLGLRLMSNKKQIHN